MCREEAARIMQVDAELAERMLESKEVAQQMLVAMLGLCDVDMISRQLLPWLDDGHSFGLLSAALRTGCFTLLKSPLMQRLLEERWCVLWPHEVGTPHRSNLTTTGNDRTLHHHRPLLVFLTPRVVAGPPL
jgi:hypothetical protein